MCMCDPTIKSPFCGKPGCVAPPPILKITLNGSVIEWNRSTITYEDIQSLCGTSGTPSVTFSLPDRFETHDGCVTVRIQRNGALAPGARLAIENGTRFTCVRT